MTTTAPTLPIPETAGPPPAPLPEHAPAIHQERAARPVASHERRRIEARRARRRFYPSTVLYTAYCAGLLVYALVEGSPVRALGFYAGGIAAWTLLEYFVHRWVLHGRFPDGKDPYHRLTHRYFDPLHWEHHARPWDGNHISGQLHDTLPFSLVFVAVAALAPIDTWPVFVAGLLQAYVIEEWVHHSVHYYDFANPYFRYIRRHHLYHHSPIGGEVAYGLTSGMWDVVFGTRVEAGIRRRLYARR